MLLLSFLPVLLFRLVTASIHDISGVTMGIVISTIILVVVAMLIAFVSVIAAVVT